MQLSNQWVNSTTINRFGAIFTCLRTNMPLRNRLASTSLMKLRMMTPLPLEATCMSTSCLRRMRFQCTLPLRPACASNDNGFLHYLSLQRDIRKLERPICESHNDQEEADDLDPQGMVACLEDQKAHKHYNIE